MEGDDEVKGKGNSYDFGARLHDPRIGRWFSMDKVIKDHLSPYGFSNNNPVLFLDPDGNDEIIFHYYLQEALNGDGKAITQIYFSAEIVKDNTKTMYISVVEHHGSLDNDQYTTWTFLDAIKENSNIATMSGRKASHADLPFSTFPVYFGLSSANMPDYTYLGILLQANPHILEAYEGSQWETVLEGAVSNAESYAVFEDVKQIYETAVAIIDGYYLFTGLVKGAATLKAMKSSGKSLGTFEYAHNFGFGTYKSLKKQTKGAGLEVHHLIEKRFAKTLGKKEGDMTSIALTKTEHKAFTKAWRDAIPYDKSNSVLKTSTATEADIFKAAKEIYKDYPVILERLGLNK